MPKIKYLDLPILRNPAHLDIVEQANRIIAAYQAQGFTLTLRQLYYQFVSRDLIPNSQKEYKRLGSIINDARLAGLIDWTAIEDRTRNLESRSHWDSPEDIVESVSQQFHVDMWHGQPNRVEVWIEKDALAGVFERACRRFDVPYLSCRGYTSQSEMWAAAQRLRRYIKAGQTPVVLHFGDHDPSGIDMTRDIRDRLSLFAGGHVELRRLALNMDQVDEYGPPPNPAKTTDSRFAGYIQEYGDESWELDALEPAVLDGLVAHELRTLIEPDAWKERAELAARGRRELAQIADGWVIVRTALADLDLPDDPNPDSVKADPDDED